MVKEPGMAQATNLQRFDVADAVRLRPCRDEGPVVVAFCSVNARGFAFEKPFAEWGMSAIHVRDPTNAWYQDGIGAPLPSPAALAAHLRAALHAMRATRIVTFGPSMGGYGALLFGALLGADGVLAFSPQTVLNRRLPHTPPADRPGEPFYDLASSGVAARLAGRRTLLAFGTEDVVDIFNVARLRPWEGLLPLGLHGRDHLAVRQSLQEGDLRAMLGHLCAGAPLALSARLEERWAVDGVRTGVEAIVQALHLDRRPQDAHAPAEAIAAAHPGWAMPHAVLAAVAEARGDAAAMARHAADAAAMAPGCLSILHLAARAAVHAGDEAEGLRRLQACLRLRRSDYGTLCNVATLQARLGQRDAALEVARRALAVRPAFPRAAALVALLEAGGTPDLAGSLAPVEDM